MVDPPAPLVFGTSATWRSGYAAACKAVYTGSIPVVAFAPRMGSAHEPTGDGTVAVFR